MSHNEDPVVVESGDEEEEELTFPTDDEAEAARLVGLNFYNDGKYGEALDIQYAVVRHFTAKFGLTNAKCGLYYLDYGLSQLRMIQSRDSATASVQPLDVEGLETCFVNLDTARVCFEKLEAQTPDDEEVQIRIAEVRNALAQVNIEQEEFDKALQEYENEVIIYRNLSTPQPRKLVSALYGMADCYMKECDFEEAEKRFQVVIDEINKLPEGVIEKDLVKDLEDLRDEAREMKDGRFKAVQELVRQQFLPEDQEVPSPAEVLSAKESNPFLSALPGGDGNSLRSVPLLGMPVPTRETSNSQSVSLFLPQGNSCSQFSQGPINHVVAVKKKPKQTPAEVPPQSDEPSAKKPRTEVPKN